MTTPPTRRDDPSERRAWVLVIVLGVFGALGAVASFWGSGDPATGHTAASVVAADDRLELRDEIPVEGFGNADGVDGVAPLVSADPAREEDPAGAPGVATEDAATGSASVDADPPPVPVSRRPSYVLEPYRFLLDFKHYYTYEEITRVLEFAAASYPELTELQSIAKSREGRDLWMIRITDENAGDPEAKPAIYVDGNIHGNEVQASEVCLYLVYTLINEHPRSERISELLRERTFYIVPSVNPDSRVRFFSEPNTPHSPRHNVRPFDNDLDGLVDEDPPEDLNGDGIITLMRKHDRFGTYKTGDDPRSFVSRELDESGEFTLYWWEGIDNDGDGRINEDGLGGVDMNRNFPADWQPWGVQWGAGPYPTSEPEIRGIVEFLRNRPNVAAVQSFHNSGNLILYPFGAHANVDMPDRDRAVHEAIAERGREILPDYDPGGIFDDLYRVYGSTVDFGYLHVGAISFTNELWGWVIDYDGDGDISQAERLRWSDERLDGEAFVDWAPFDHPELGEIEIGGWNQFHSRMPPVSYLEELCRLNADFVLFHAEAMPRLEITHTSVDSLDADLFAVNAFVANTGIMDTYPEVSDRLGISRPVIVELRTEEGLEVVEGASRPRERTTRTVTFDPVDRRRPVPARIEIDRIQGGEEVAVRWLVSGRGEAVISVTSDKAGSITSEPLVFGR